MGSGTSRAGRSLAVIATGGTIAMRAGRDAPAQISLTGQDLIAACPYLAELAELTVDDVLRLPSSSLTLADMGRIAQAVTARADADGIIVTHGTDTLEETAFLLACTAQLKTPVVLTGAMRRFDQAGAEGAANLEAAALTALAPASRGKGVLVVMDDEIHSGPLVRKIHSFRTHAFSSQPFGPVGWVRERQVRYALAPVLGLPRLAVGEARAVVPILEAGPGLEPEVLAALAEVADGLVVSLNGGGHVAAACAPILQELAARMPVVFASRIGAGGVLAASYGYAGSESDLLQRGLISAGALDARKARILAMLLLSTEADLARVRGAFAALP